MELKMKFQYTNFVYPYIVEEKDYKKYLLKLLKMINASQDFLKKKKIKNYINIFYPI